MTDIITKLESIIKESRGANLTSLTLKSVSLDELKAVSVDTGERLYPPDEEKPYYSLKISIGDVSVKLRSSAYSTKHYYVLRGSSEEE